MSIDPATSSLILAGASFLVALAYSIKKAKDCQLGTCCRVSLESPRHTTPDIINNILPNVLGQQPPNDSNVPLDNIMIHNNDTNDNANIANNDANNNINNDNGIANITSNTNLV